MLQPGNGYALRAERYPWWAADNGCFKARWTEDRWIDWLAQVPLGRGLLFAVAPDVYPDASASLARGLEFAPILRDMGFPVAIVAQDGAEGFFWPWEEFDCLFVGGERRSRAREEWKLGAAAEGLVREARSRGLWVHMGRVNSWRRLVRAIEMGCNSADGTALKYKPVREGLNLREWSTRPEYEPQLPLRRHEAPAHPLHRAAAIRSSEPLGG